MRWIVFVLVAGVALAGVVASMASASGQADGEAAPSSESPSPPDTATGDWSRWPTKKATSMISAPFWATT
jgi:hypothetical protein